MTLPEVTHLSDQIQNHLRLFYAPDAKSVLNTDSVLFLSYDACSDHSGPNIVIPVDRPLPPRPQDAYQVPFNGTVLTIWNRIPIPSRGDWQPFPNDTTPLWYRSASGTLMPAWNLFGNLMQLLTFGEENDPRVLDEHGRFAASASPRFEAGLLGVPAFNESVAALVAACRGISTSGSPMLELRDVVNPPVLVLSHDCDILLGNRAWTQYMRARGILGPIKRFRPPKIGNLWWILRNQLWPRRFYFDNTVGMIDVEQLFGHHSTFYLLNGHGGRYGAAGGIGIVKELAKRIPESHDIGIHYNYDTFLDEERFRRQFDELQNAIESPIDVGRAHYLRLDPQRSFEFLTRFGIRIDESSGYAGHIGYRNGIAGCFQPYDSARKRPHDIWELPLTIMDATLVKQYAGESLLVVDRMLHHLSRVGGALTILFHPGQFFNPEYDHMLGIYHTILVNARAVGAVSMTARMLVNN